MHFFVQIRLFIQVTLLAVSFFLLMPYEVQSADITLKWDIVEDARVEGYNIYCGKSGTDFKLQPVLSIDQRSQTTCTISGLEEGAVYGFAATSFDKEGRESRFSEEIYHSISAEGPADSDGDGLTDDEEINIYGSNPDKADTDGDGISDGEEVQWWGESWQEDMDGDGTINLLDPDSDGDGVPDGMDAIQNPEPTPGNDHYRINVGGPKVTLGGVVWMKDTFYSGGRTYFKGLPISGTSEDPIYQSERFGKSFQYELPLQNGNYTVKLHFAEIYWNSSDKRVFSVDIENGQAQLAGYDIYSKAGGMAALVETFSSISVQDGVLNIQLSTKKDHAKLSAIEVTPSQDESDTDTGNTTDDSALYRINAGGPEVTLNGVVWMKDSFFSGGRTYFKGLPVSGTSEDAIYQSERFGKSFQYELPIENGNYTVELHFAEIYWNNSGKRVFSVDIEDGQAQLAGYDIYSKAGGMAALVETFSSISVNDGVLNIYLSTKVDHAKLSAIEVTPSQHSSETDTGNTTDDSVLYRINAGGPEVTLNGKIWERDGFYSGGNTYLKNASISGSTEDPIFHTERYGKNFDYRFPVEAGTYTVKLYLSEIYWKDTGKRVFHANIEKSQGILDFYDIFQEVGGFAADLKIFENIAVSDGVLNIEFTTESDNAKISAIEVIPY